MFFAMQYVRSFLHREKGEDVAEYALVLGLVAIAAVIGITLVGTNLQIWWNTLGGYIGTIPAP